MSFVRSYDPYASKGGSLYDGYWSNFPANFDHQHYFQHSGYDYNNYKQNLKNFSLNCNFTQYPNETLGGTRNHNNYQDVPRNYREPDVDNHYVNSHNSPSYKRRKISNPDAENSRKYTYQPIQSNVHANASANYKNITAPTSDTSANYNVPAPTTNTSANCYNIPAPARPSMVGRAYTTGKRDRSELELENDSDSVLMSKEEIERCSPSRKDGIDALNETRLRYSYCTFLQNLGMRLELPQTTIGTAMVLCHRFFLRRSHACHDRYLIATAALFLTGKSEETARPLNNLLTTSCEIVHRQDMSILTYMFPIGWFEQYRERVLEAEQLILTTLNFELEVEHPFDPLTSVLEKLGLSQSMLVNMALSLLSEGVYTRLTSEVELLMCWGSLNTKFSMSS